MFMLFGMRVLVPMRCMSMLVTMFVMMMVVPVRMLTLMLVLMFFRHY
jgi:hypothetical protein